MAYLQYVRHLEKTSTFVKAATTAGTVEHFAQGYQDYLQAPLQVSPIHLLHPTALAQWVLFSRSWTICKASHTRRLSRIR